MTPAPAAPSNGKILVVDDNPIIQRAVFFQLRDKGFKVLMCGDLTEALTVVRAEKPDVIVLDIHFPGENSTIGEARDGFWATKWFRRNEESRNTPVILISSADPAEAEPRALAAGAAGYLPKPLDKEKLVAVIQKLMAEKKPDAPSTPGLRMAS